MQLAKTLEAIADEMGLAQRHEPRRLFEAKEYRAAVISAMTLLESTLRRRLDKPSLEAVRRPMSMRDLVEHAAKEGIARDYYRHVSVWMKLRNDVVHGGRRVSRQEAQAVVEGVERIIDAL